MKKLFVSLLSLTLFIQPFFPPALQANATNNTTIPGYRLIEKRFVKEINSTCYYYEHVKSGAKVFKMANDDPNKMFSITFKTLPDNDCGTAHIMEHSVLNGSLHFPVKSPFDIAVKGSLNTFINAFTSKDRTSFPVASMNEKDYFNLMHIYLDAVFNPLIYQNEKIFKQEGWHYELTDLNADIQYRGVVYGEMKGSFSNPARYVTYYTYKNLFPGNVYGYESGGYPYAIPELTWDEFKAFHTKYYHPDNCYIVLYGNEDVEKELSFIDKEYLSKYEKRNINFPIEEHRPFPTLKRVEAHYPVMEGAQTKNQTFLNLCYVTNHGKDITKTYALSILAYYLFNNESAPVRLALEKAGIGKNVSCSVQSYKQNIAQIQLQNANPEELDTFYNIIIRTLKETLNKGIDKSEIESVLNAYEFSLREDNNAQKGISYLSNVLPDFMYNNDPFAGLLYEKVLVELRENLKTDYYEELITSTFLDNNYALLLSVSPKPGLDKEFALADKAKLKAYKDRLSETELNQLIHETKALIQYQESKDSPEDIAKIPNLSLSDIDKKASYYAAEYKEINNHKILFYNDHTNDIVYLKLFFDLRVLPQEMIPYVSLLSDLLGAVDTKNYSYEDLNKAINNHTGGIQTSLILYLENNDDDNLIPKFLVSSKATVSKRDALLELNKEIVCNSVFNDTNRLKNLIKRLHVQLQSQFYRDGSRLASGRLSSYISKSGLFNEYVSGYEYYLFLSDLVKELDKNPGKIIDNLHNVSRLLFTKDNLMIGLACNTDNFNTLIPQLPLLSDALQTHTSTYKKWNLTMKNKNEAFSTSSKVQYVYSGYNFKKIGYEYNGKMLVLNRIMSRDWLNQEIRIKGGAYGGYSTLSYSGNVSFVSYRDPNLSETLEKYKQTSDFLQNLQLSEKEMTQFIIGTIAGLDQPKNITAKSMSAYGNYFTKTDASFYQKERDAILSTSLEDIRSYAKMIKEIANKNVVCVYGNAEKLESNKQLFSKLIKIE